MKKVTLFIALIFIASALFAQSNKEDIAILQSMFGKEKKELVIAYMTIAEDKKAAFWALYDQYEDERKALGRERVSLIEGYANDYATLDDKKAEDLMVRKIKWQENYTKFQKNYYGKFSKVIGSLQASKLMQLEDYLENNIRLYIQESIPFIGELDKTKVKPQ